MRRFTRLSIHALAATAALALLAPAAAAATFTISPGPANRITFDNEAPLESITGITNAATGALTLDLAKPSGTTGQVSVPVASISTGIAMRDEHLQSDQWLDAKAHPNLTLVIDRVEGGEALTDGKSVTVKVHGSLTIKGKTNKVVVPAKISFHKVSEASKKAYITQDVLRVRALLKINMRDYGVIPAEHLAGVKVADEVEIKASLTAFLK